MPEKRHWISKVYDDSPSCDQSEKDILWSNSDSSDQETSTEKENIKKSRKTKTPFPKSLKDWITHNTTPEKRISVSRRSQTIDELESPVISEVQKEDRSPSLLNSPPHRFQDKSPVINHRRVIKKIKWHHKVKKQMQTVNISQLSLIKSQVISLRAEEPKSFTQTIQDESFDISSQSTVRIDSFTQFSTKLEEPEFKQYKIEPFLSQNSSEVISATTSITTGSSSSGNENFFRKKRYKKGRLANQLQKALKLRISSTAIWHHEIYLSKQQNKFSKINEEDALDFFITKKWTEYGCTLLECHSNNISDVPNAFIIILGSSNDLNLSFELNKLYRIYTPFFKKSLHYNGESVCVVDGSRLISL